MQNVSPGEHLKRSFLEPRGLSQYRLAKDIGVPASRISAITNDKRLISPDTDRRLCGYFSLPSGYWLRHQADHAAQPQEASPGCLGKDPVLALLRQQLPQWQQRFQLAEIGLFGSMARDEATPTSDVDVWVRFDQLEPYAAVHLKRELEALLDRPVDLVRLRERMNPALRQRILAEGVQA